MVQHSIFPLSNIVALLFLLSDYGSSFSLTQPQRHKQYPSTSVQHVGLLEDTPSRRGIQLLRLDAATSKISSSTDDSKQRQPRFLDEKQLDFFKGYLNKHHGIALLKFAEIFSEIGIEKGKKNAWSGGAYNILSATIIDIDTECFELEVQVQERNMESKMKKVTVELGKKNNDNSIHSNMCFFWRLFLFFFTWLFFLFFAFHF
ncbi:MAG: hypothetical protein ACI90V_005325 [Bacillariaceae sp.]|jgi:hypothetical protein